MEVGLWSKDILSRPAAKIGAVMVSEERLEAILAGIEKVKQNKPYDDNAEAVAALDWISAATADLTGALAQYADDTAAIGNIRELLDTLERLHASISARIKRSGGRVPRRHDEQSTGTVNP